MFSSWGPSMQAHTLDVLVDTTDLLDRGEIVWSNVHEFTSFSQHPKVQGAACPTP